MITFAVRTPKCTHLGLGSYHFARRYFGNRFFFLFLRLLRCFSSPGSPPQLMDWAVADRSLSCRVSPFRYLRIDVYLPLPAAFRSLSRLSSALSAKASTLRSFRFLFSLVFSRMSWITRIISYDLNRYQYLVFKVHGVTSEKRMNCGLNARVHIRKLFVLSVGISCPHSTEHLRCEAEVTTWA